MHEPGGGSLDVGRSKCSDPVEPGVDALWWLGVIRVQVSVSVRLTQAGNAAPLTSTAAVGHEQVGQERGRECAGSTAKAINIDLHAPNPEVNRTPIGPMPAQEACIADRTPALYIDHGARIHKVGLDRFDRQGRNYCGLWVFAASNYHGPLFIGAQAKQSSRNQASPGQ